MNKVTVLGAGAWGTTMAQVLADCGNDVLLWGRSTELVNEINNSHTNKKYLGEHVLPSQLKSTGKSLIAPDALIVSTLKGIELTSDLRMTEVIVDVLGTKNYAIITGPNLADELILRQPAGAVAAAPTSDIATKVQRLFSTPYYRVYTSTDVVGCELAGAIKSIIALAVGMSIGMGFGENTQAMLITRGLNEVARIGAAHGADPLSAAGLAGMGDLVASCGSALSRNRTFGEVLGRTGSMNDAREHVAKTVEGVASSSAVVELAHRVGVEVPVIEAVADVVAGTITPKQALERLMAITTKAENFIR